MHVNGMSIINVYMMYDNINAKYRYWHCKGLLPDKNIYKQNGLVMNRLVMKWVGYEMGSYQFSIA